MKINKWFSRKFIGILTIIIIFIFITPVSTFGSTLEDFASKSIPNMYTYIGTELIKVNNHDIIAIGIVETDVIPEINNPLITFHPSIDISSSGTNTSDWFGDVDVLNGYYYVIYYKYDQNGPITVYSLVPLDITKASEIPILKLL